MPAKAKKYIFENGSNCSSKFELVEVKIGDWVGFKSDYEQSGEIVAIKKVDRGWSVGWQLTLRNEHGFGGEYLRYATECVMDAEDCWVD
jgi:hypothetical protein